MCRPVALLFSPGSDYILFVSPVYMCEYNRTALFPPENGFCMQPDWRVEGSRPDLRARPVHITVAVRTALGCVWFCQSMRRGSAETHAPRPRDSEICGHTSNHRTIDVSGAAEEQRDGSCGEGSSKGEAHGTKEVGACVGETPVVLSPRLSSAHLPASGPHGYGQSHVHGCPRHRSGCLAVCGGAAMPLALPGASWLPLGPGGLHCGPPRRRPPAPRTPPPRGPHSPTTSGAIRLPRCPWQHPIRGAPTPFCSSAALAPATVTSPGTVPY
jgi:hypothetical protein